MHSDRLALVDRGNQVVGYFDSNDPEAIAALVAQARQPTPSPRRGSAGCPAVNASLNATCAAAAARWAGS